MEDFAVPVALAADPGFLSRSMAGSSSGGKRHSSRCCSKRRSTFWRNSDSAPEVTQFLASAEGKDFIDRLKPPPPPPQEKSKPPGPAEVLFAMIWAGMIMLGIGIGFIVGIPVEPKLVIPGAVIGLAGLGMLIGLRITHYLATRWGLFKRPDISQGSRNS